MRQRIREVAATGKVSENEIKAALSLKHEAVWHFYEQHGVCVGWLLEADGPIFKSDSVCNLPMVDQHAIKAKIRQIVDGRLDETPPPIA